MRTATIFSGNASSKPSARNSLGSSAGFKSHSLSLAAVAEPTTAIGIVQRTLPIRSMNCSTAFALVNNNH